MKKIASFTIDHIKLQPGIYVSRKDYLGDEVITTFDIRMTSPNEEPVMNTAELHAMEHLAATFLRNHTEFGPKIIYWGTDGMPYRQLPASGRRLRIQRYRAPDDRKCLNLSVISREKFQAHPQRTAATTST